MLVLAQAITLFSWTLSTKANNESFAISRRLRDPLMLRFMLLESFFHVHTLLTVSPKVPYCIILKVITDRWNLRQHVYPSRMPKRMRRTVDREILTTLHPLRPPFGVLSSGCSYSHYHTPDPSGKRRLIFLEWYHKYARLQKFIIKILHLVLNIQH